jgi:hypothetical protein
VRCPVHFCLSAFTLCFPFISLLVHPFSLFFLAIPFFPPITVFFFTHPAGVFLLLILYYYACLLISMYFIPLFFDFTDGVFSLLSSISIFILIYCQTSILSFLQPLLTQVLLSLLLYLFFSLVHLSLHYPSLMMIHTIY